MRRREFISLAGGAIAALPFAARAQQPARTRRIGLLMIHSDGDFEAQARIGVFRQQLSELGWFEGRNIQIDYRWGIADAARAQAAAAELVALAPDVIVANGTVATVAAQLATRRIPIVFVVVTDPAGAGLVQSQAKPVATSPASAPSSRRSAASGLSCCGRFRLGFAAWPACSIPHLSDLRRCGGRSKSSGRKRV